MVVLWSLMVTLPLAVWTEDSRLPVLLMDRGGLKGLWVEIFASLSAALRCFLWIMSHEVV